MTRNLFYRKFKFLFFSAPEEKKPTEEKKEEPLKETFRLAIGTYKATIVPLIILFFGFFCGTLSVRSMKPDPRVGNWFLMQSSVVCLLICILYVLFSIVWGPNLMKNREPFQFRKVMITYNAFQVVLSSYMFFEVRTIKILMKLRY